MNMLGALADAAADENADPNTAGRAAHTPLPPLTGLAKKKRPEKAKKELTPAAENKKRIISQAFKADKLVQTLLDMGLINDIDDCRGLIKMGLKLRQVEE